MPSFTDQEIEDQWPIWQLFQNGGVVLFYNPPLLDSAAASLTESGYQVHSVTCQPDADEQTVLFAIVDSLGIPRYRNIGLDGFNDFVSEISFNNCTGVVVILKAFDCFWRKFPESAFQILDILADHHRLNLLLGNRLLTLVQSDDPRIDKKLGKVGGYSPSWNPAEWMNEKRGL